MLAAPTSQDSDAPANSCPRAESTAPGSAEPEISVIIVTYNHRSLIEQAIESVLRQETGRPFEIVISEDASTDGTREIVQEFARRDGRIKLILSERNLRSNEVVARGIRAARGRYLCLLDGDDCWTANDKLERQAALLDEDGGAAGCFHNAAIAYGHEEPSDQRWTPATQPRRTGSAEIWRGNPFATCASMLRRDALSDLGGWYADLFPITDWPLYILAAARGDLLFVDDVVGAYRLHEGGLFSARPGLDKLRMTSRLYRRMRAVAANDRQRASTTGSTLYFLEWAEEYARLGNARLKLASLWYSARAGAFGAAFPWRRFLAAAFRQHRP